MVLFEGAAGELRTHWSLRANDAVSAAAGFPASGGRPAPVLRLRRLRADGGSDPVQEVRLRPEGLAGEGEMAFAVGRDYGRFEAELGLINQDGGWLALARSNRLERAASIGLDLSGLGRARRRPPRVGRGSTTAVAAPQDPPPRDPVVPVPVGAVAVADPAPGEAGDQALAIPTARDGIETSATTRIPLLVYGCPASPGTGLVIEAELRISGRAAPNSEIDLFGHRYRIGPGGRFQLQLRVDDPDLLRRALAQHPPPELGCSRED